MIVDIHTHVSGGRVFGMSRVSAAEFVAGLDRSGVDKAIIYTVDGFFFDFVTCNDELPAFAQKLPGRLVPGPTVDPRHGRAAVDEMRRCQLELGMKGPLKIHGWLQGFSPMDPAMELIAETAMELGMPILFHDGTPPYSTSLQVATVAARFPQLTVILGHSGMRDMWLEALAAAKRCPNIMLCTCTTAPHGLERMVREVDARRIMMGTDHGFGLTPGNQESRVEQIRQLDISNEVKALIMGENAQRLFQLE